MRRLLSLVWIALTLVAGCGGGHPGTGAPDAGSDVDANAPGDDAGEPPSLMTTEVATLISTDSTVQELGRVVALSADGSTALLSSLDLLPSSSAIQSARVFARSGTTWSEQAHLTTGDGALANEFGRALALSADGSRALIGASADTSGATGAGSARVFLRVGSTWSEEATLTALGGELGNGVALSADGSRALVGAPTEVVGGTDTGAAHVFVRTGTSWTEEAALHGLNVGSFGELGAAVALSADGAFALVAAITDANLAGVYTGTVRVFVRSGVVWSEQATLAPRDAVALDNVGTSVALDASGTRAVISSLRTDTYNSGRAWVFARAGSTWAEEAELVSTTSHGRDAYGSSVSISADGSRAIVGVPDNTTVGGGGAGSATVFVHTGTNWLDEATLLAGDGAVADRFGCSVALSGDGTLALVGAYEDDTTIAADGGSGRVFTLGP